MVSLRVPFLFLCAVSQLLNEAAEAYRTWIISSRTSECRVLVVYLMSTLICSSTVLGVDIYNTRVLSDSDLAEIFENGESPRG